MTEDGEMVQKNTVEMVRRPSDDRESRFHNFKRSFAFFSRASIAGMLFGLPAQNDSKDLPSKTTFDHGASVRIWGDSIKPMPVDQPGFQLSGLDDEISEKHAAPRPPEEPVEQEVGGIYELLTLPSEGNIRSGTTTRSEVLFNFDAIRNYNAGHPTEELVVQLVSIVQGDQAYNDGNTDWFQLNIVGRNPATIVPEPFSQGGFVFSGVLAPEVRDAATVTLTATPGTPEAGDPVTQPAPEAEPAPIAPSPQPQPPTTEPPVTGGTPPPDTETPEGNGDPATPVPPLSQGAGAPGGEAGIEIVDAGQRALLESARETQYNAFPPEIRTRIDAGEIWFDYEMGTFAQRNERGIPIYWAGGMAEQDGTVVGDWLEVMSELNYNGTRVIIRMNPDEMLTRPREAGFNDIDFANADGGSLENWLNSFGSALNGKRVIIDLVPNWTSSATNSSLIATVLQGAPNGAPILAVNGVIAENGDYRIKLYASSLGTTFSNMFRGQVLEEADEAFISKGILTAMEISNIMARENLTALSGSQLIELYNQYMSQASYWAMLPADATVPLDQQPRVVDISR